jgi:hypothetical protein
MRIAPYETSPSILDVEPFSCDKSRPKKERRMKKIIVMMAIIFAAGMFTAAFGEATLTLKSGEVLKGDIVSDTNGVVQFRAYFSNHTMSSLRNVPRADIQDLVNETPEQIDFHALSVFRLDPDQQQPPAFYTQWVAAFERFLKDYPQSDKTAVIQQHIEECQTELSYVTAGEAKFGNRWMTPEEQKPLALTKQLAQLEDQWYALARHSTSPESIAELEGIDAEIQNVKFQLPLAQHAYEVSLGNLTPPPVVQAPVVEKAPQPPEASWHQKQASWAVLAMMSYWKLLVGGAIGAAIIMVLLLRK